MSDVFDKQKAASLSGVDLSRKGSVDDPIQHLVIFINKQQNYFTTSSCSGRILIADNVSSPEFFCCCFCVEMQRDIQFSFLRVENIVGKGENAVYQHFLLFPECF